jgi:enoyl-CoA hydratase
VSELVATAFEEGVLHVTLSRPEKRNALSNALIAAIGATFSKWSERDDISVAVLTGAGDKAFASGGDLKELESLRDEAGALAFAARTRAALGYHPPLSGSCGRRAQRRCARRRRGACHGL